MPGWKRSEWIHTVAPGVTGVKSAEQADPFGMAVAEAVRAACLPYVSMNRLSDVEHMDLHYIVLAVAADMRKQAAAPPEEQQQIIAPQYGQPGPKPKKP